MGWFSRRRERGKADRAGLEAPDPVLAETPGADPVPIEEPPDEAPPEPPPQPPPLQEPDPGTEIRVSRTLVKSEPELAALVASEPTLAAEGVQVSLSEKGFGTRVAITAAKPSGLSEDDLERLLDALAEPQKRPFTNN